jgi:hypothetical protein
MSEFTSVVATFSDLEKARAVEDWLVRAGIPAVTQDESKLQKFWFLSRALAAEKVRVKEKDFRRARQMLEDADITRHILQGEILCPKCRSSDIEYPQFTRKFITTTMVEICCLLNIIDREFYCMRCHFTWPTRFQLPPKIDRLNWPIKEDVHSH